MDFWLTDDQRDLQDGMRSFVQGRFPLDDTRDREGSGSAIDRQRWRELADMGVFSLRDDGLGAREAALVFEELGRALVPGPLVSSHLAAGLVDGASTGGTIVTRVDPQPDGHLVEHATDAEWALHFVDGRVESVAMSGLAWDPEPVARPLDALSPVWRCRSAEPGGDVVAGGDEATALHRLGITLTAAQALGVALAATDLATAYAKEREQFDRPIGSFQAVKHLLAEMLTKAEVARAAVYAAACTLDGASDDDADRAVGSAKVMASEAALFCGKTGIQVHGGMGFTWEVDAQRYWKRAVVLDNTFGSAEHHAMAVAARLGA